ncbi:hydroxyacid dehydrogenase [Mesorhizobium sp. M6A.T.Cr.TU.016.01.1.1]|uniref:hydroxyacid dehydrogenase n=1 Tax=Mesorhizobium sp. M6A.T.Cr.TU.016.01.1.1 TaxID=2493677 RepID=UPI000F74DA14|nr:hydroxyacid dehydrogenase [Mesorhizobium sp. M6A.T.Cr.TU.016.01.1.1]AZO67991.1 hydroxyacid dehydrogenase [Mesorhizobium sp. M6A.T.Cr.TU.016.01.1.1]
MPHILVAGKLHPSGVALLNSLPDVTFDYVEEVSEQSYAPLIGKADALVLRTQPLSAETVAKADRLRVVSRHGVGYDAVHLPSLNERGIALTIVGDVNSVSVAEHAMMLILAASKRALRADRSVRLPNEWGWRNNLEAEEISGKHLLIVGFGRIGRHLARMASGFGMEVRAFDPYLQEQGWPEGPVRAADTLRDGLSWADVISINIPKADQPLIGRAEFAVMRRGAILVNTARGGIVEEQALVDALRSGQVGAAGLDVFDSEPPAEGNPLVNLDQVILSPHIAGLTKECGERMAVASVRNVIDFFSGKIDPALVVNRSAGKAA